jgi:hypothetical protein
VNRKQLHIKTTKQITLIALFAASLGRMGANSVIAMMRTNHVSHDLELPHWIDCACVTGDSDLR